MIRVPGRGSPAVVTLGSPFGRQRPDVSDSRQWPLRFTSRFPEIRRDESGGAWGLGRGAAPPRFRGGS